MGSLQDPPRHLTMIIKNRDFVKEPDNIPLVCLGGYVPTWTFLSHGKSCRLRTNWIADGHELIGSISGVQIIQYFLADYILAVFLITLCDLRVVFCRLNSRRISWPSHIICIFGGLSAQTFERSHFGFWDRPWAVPVSMHDFRDLFISGSFSRSVWDRAIPLTRGLLHRNWLDGAVDQAEIVPLLNISQVLIDFEQLPPLVVDFYAHLLLSLGPFEKANGLAPFLGAQLELLNPLDPRLRIIHFVFL